ncbi:MAG: tail fiber domain-containing protein [Candidatus Paceibacterota bacterium]
MKTEKFLKKFFAVLKKRSFFPNKKHSLRDGFSLMELLVYTGIFTITAGLMVGVVSTVSDVQVRETANVEVNDQSQFVMNAIKSILTGAKAVDITAGTAVSTLKVRVNDAAKDPTFVYLENGIVYKKETDNGAPVALTDKTVNVTALNFTRMVNPPGKDVVKIDMTMVYNSTQSNQQITRNYRSAVSKVSAITFDSDLLPSTDNTYNVGASNPRWLNGFFSGNVNVGGLLNIGTATSDPSGQNGSLYYNTTSNVFRGYVNGAWADFGSGGGGTGSWSTSGSNLYTTGSVGIGTSTIPNKLTVTGNASISGNVGIGTTSPEDKLDVRGIARLGDYNTATSDAIKIGASAYAGSSQSVQLGQWTSDTVFNPILFVGSGATYNGNVGIGTTAPTGKLHVVGSSGVPHPTTPANSGVLKVGTDAGVHIQMGYVDGSRAWIQNYGGLPLYINELGNNVILNSGGGNVGIGTTGPVTKLDVAFPLNTGGLALSSPGYDSDLYNSALTLRSTTKTGAQSDVVFYHAGASNYNGVYIWNYPANAVGGCCHPIAFFGTKDDGTDYSYFPSNVNVGIGTASPAQKLHIYGSGPDLRIEDTATSGNFLDLSSNTNKHWVWGVGSAAPMVFGTNNAERMRIDASGYVGIGTTAPAFPVEIKKTVSANWQLHGLNGAEYYLGHSSGYGMHINTYNTSDSIYAMQLYNGTNDLFDVYNSGKIYMRGAVGIGAVINSGYSTDYKLQVGGGSGSNGIMIRAGSTGTSKLSFDYEQNADGLGRIWYDSASNSFSIYTIGTEKIRVTSGGNVGIGTTAPTAKLEVAYAGANAEVLTLQDTYVGNGSVAYKAYFTLSNGGCSFGDGLHIGFYNTGSAGPHCTSMPGNVLSLLKGGNVGIGTTAPAAQLHVSGNTYITGGANGGLSIGEAPVNYDGWDRQLNLNGTGHARLTVKTASVRMGMYAHDSWHSISGVATGGFVGTYNNYPVGIVVNSSPVMVFNTSGNVGIGTTAPTTRLNVNGNINLGDGTVQYNMNTDNAIIWGSGDTVTAYSIKTKYKQYTNTASQTYTYSRLQLNWHTGIEIGASPTYGGTRFFNNYPDSGTQIFSVGDGDSNVRAVNNIYAAGFFYSSDARLKKDFKVIENPIDKIMKLSGGTFTWKKDGIAGIGVIAQEVEKVFPELVSTDKKTGMKSVQYGNLVAPLIEAVKEQQAEIQGLEKRIEKMEALME